MTATLRVQLSRAKGWRKPVDAIVVARPTKWGNPYRADEVVTRRDVVQFFAGELREILDDPWGKPHSIEMRVIAESLGELRGHDLACWCPLDQPCHADVLLELANA